MDFFLKYTNENGEARRIPVRAEKFTIGRHSENDLCIPRNQLSRSHAEIDRYEDVFVLTDNDSSNGTTLNGQRLERPTALKNGDKFNLGGGVDLEVEMSAGFAGQKAQTGLPEAAPGNSSPANLPPGGTASAEAVSAEAAESESVAQAQIASEVSAKDIVPAMTAAPAAERSGMGIFFIIAPVLVLFVLLIGGLILLLAGGGGGGSSKPEGNNGGFIYSSDNGDDDGGDGDDKPNKNKKIDIASTTPTPSSSPRDSGNTSPGNSPNNSSTPSSSPGSTPVPISSESDTIERNSLSFLRRIAKTDPNPVLTGKQIDIINATIKSVKSSALKDNLQALKKSSSQIEALAKTKNLRPQFLAVAALAKLGSTRGDPLSTAQGMADELNQLSNVIANDFSDDSLMIIAAYQEGGAKSGMPGMIANLTKSSPADARKIRSIWFLHDKGKISEAQYQFALRFLALGTITQNPKDFSVDSDAVVFN